MYGQRNNSAKKPVRNSAISKTPSRGVFESEKNAQTSAQKTRKPAISSKFVNPASATKPPGQSVAAARNRAQPVVSLPSPRGSTAGSRSTASTPRGSDEGDLQMIGTLRQQLDAETNSLADNVKVVVRVRPLDRNETQGSLLELQSNQVSLVSTHDHEKTFEFDHVAGPAATQEHIFQVAGSPIVDRCMSGFNVSLFAYGQTSAGKTHTMTGDLSNPEQSGLGPRLLEHLFQQISEAEDREGQGRLKFTVKASYLELYKERITDLLGPADGPELQLREDVRTGVYVEGLTEREILNADDALAVVQQGSARRRTNATRMNHESSRSHAVLTVYIQSFSRTDSDVEHVRSSRLNLVDLAGSERNKASGATGERFREACSINQSLTTLGRVISELVEAQQHAAAQQPGAAPRHIPYRESKLTFLLQDSLGGNSKTLVIACVSPAEEHAAESASTLEFAARAKRIRNRARVNQEHRGDEQLLRRELERLTRELELRDAAAEAEVAELRRQLEATRAQTAPQRPDHATAQRLSAAEEHCRRAEEELEQERELAKRSQSHMEAACSNMREQLQQARLDALADRKAAATARAEASETSRARAALAEELQCAQKEAAAGRAAAQARESRLQAKLSRLQEELAEVSGAAQAAAEQAAEEQRRASKWKSAMQSATAAFHQAQTPKGQSKSGPRRPTILDVDVQ